VGDGARECSRMAPAEARLTTIAAPAAWQDRRI
jgi:hypothetical protein